MNDRKFIILVVAATILILGGGAMLATKLEGSSSQVQYSQNAKVEVGETSYDWGEININGGNVEKTFQIKNAGTDVLELSDVVTSCMCTTARLTQGDIQSPAFGMHAKSSYVMEVNPGETANLTVTFDPAYHGPNGVGPINRQVTVKTNDFGEPELNFILTAMVRK